MTKKLANTDNSSKKIIAEVKKISKSFLKTDKQDLVVLDNVNTVLYEGEIVALLGKSGSGKSTLLRIIAGLITPSAGEVIYRNKIIKSPMPDISMVFQNFALMPWLTVLQNVELGLQARKINPAESRKKALKAIDMIGLDGFENAYPKELSGGMRQRVGFARALVIEPDLLLMDEPFSALDILTAENLREDLIQLWEKNDTMKGILYVTHSIEEAILTADRVMVFGSNPGYISGEIAIDIPHPRSSQDLEVTDLIDDVYRMMTEAQTFKLNKKVNKKQVITIAYRLPEVEVAEITGLLAEMYDLQEKGTIDLPDLADHTRLDIDDLFPIIEALSLLDLANISDGDITMTNSGKKFMMADIESRKVLFSNLLKTYIPLAKNVIKVLKERPENRASESRFINELEDHLSEEEAKRVFDTFVDWARYAEIIEYDAKTQIITLDKTNT